MTLESPPADTAAIDLLMQQRARELARPILDGAAAGERVEVLEFILAHERYAIETAWVQEVYPLRQLTPLPGTPAFVLGIVNVRGKIVSVMDLRVFFGLPARGITDLNKVMILGDGEMEFGILGDVIIGTRMLPLADIQPPLPTLTGVRADYLKGVTASQSVVLDAQRLLRASAVVVDQPSA
ncbi:chemotaxis protein CheW [Amantichitinum ursilacus]|uniref:Chemotaxis protein CheW n=1 Tax=Amantichitinum ursilacus TaxID=857265 RepID=A0A0N0GR82_9NEIS|nr:chemotaxis protein CheW [Amantichitinum ursilacus]KPC55189.1 Chemotaxis protein CheW [Amantichitinum ursilacus]